MEFLLFVVVELNLKNFKTRNVTNMEKMFMECKSLRKLNLSSFNTKKVGNMLCMFDECSSLNELDISPQFIITEKTYTYCMFRNCSKDAEKKIKLQNKNIKIDEYHKLKK